MRRVSEISAGVISVAKLPKFRPLFSKRFARRKEGEKKPDTGRSANLPQGENVLRVSLLSPPLFLFFFFKQKREFFPPSSSSSSLALKGREGEEKCRARIIEPRQRPTFMEMDGINERRDEIRIRTRKQSLSARFSHLFLYLRLTNGEDDFGIICKICGKKRE